MVDCKGLIVFLTAFASLGAQAKDHCDGWTVGGRVVMEACSYPDGSSGYWQVTNTGSRSAHICWEVNLVSGRRMQRCDTIDPGQQSSGSCRDCGSKYGGAHTISLEKYEVQ
jgi:hypothetical protein